MKYLRKGPVTFCTIDESAATGYDRRTTHSAPPGSAALRAEYTCHASSVLL